MDRHKLQHRFIKHWNYLQKLKILSFKKDYLSGKLFPNEWKFKKNVVQEKLSTLYFQQVMILIGIILEITTKIWSILYE